MWNVPSWVFWAILVITLAVIAVRYLIHAATNEAIIAAEEIQGNMEDFKIPKIKIKDVIGYGAYQMFEMAKPGLQAMMEDWVREQQKGGPGG